MTDEVKAIITKVKEQTKRVSENSRYRDRPPEVRIMDGHYHVLFMAKELDIIKITSGYDGEEMYCGVSVIDYTHLFLVSESGWDSVYHVAEFGERMAQCGNKVELVEDAE
jgi:hypothetical protein